MSSLPPALIERREKNISRFLACGMKHEFVVPGPLLTYDRVLELSFTLAEAVKADELTTALQKVGMSTKLAEQYVSDFCNAHPSSEQGITFEMNSSRSRRSRSRHRQVRSTESPFLNTAVNNLLTEDGALDVSPRSMADGRFFPSIFEEKEIDTKRRDSQNMKSGSVSNIGSIASNSNNKSRMININLFCSEYRRLMRMICLRFLQIRCLKKNTQVVPYKKCSRLLQRFVGPRYGTMDLTDLFGVDHMFLRNVHNRHRITLTDLARWYFNHLAMQALDRMEEQKEMYEHSLNVIPRVISVLHVLSTRQENELQCIFNEVSGGSDACTLDMISNRCGPGGKGLVIFLKNFVSGNLRATLSPSNKRRLRGRELVTSHEWLEFFQTNPSFKNKKTLDGFIADMKTHVEQTRMSAEDESKDEQRLTVYAPAQIKVLETDELGRVRPTSSKRPQSVKHSRKKSAIKQRSMSQHDVSGRLSLKIREYPVNEVVEPQQAKVVLLGKDENEQDLNVTFE